MGRHSEVGASHHPFQIRKGCPQPQLLPSTSTSLPHPFLSFPCLPFPSHPPPFLSLGSPPSTSSIHLQLIRISRSFPRTASNQTEVHIGVRPPHRIALHYAILFCTVTWRTRLHRTASRHHTAPHCRPATRSANRSTGLSDSEQLVRALAMSAGETRWGGYVRGMFEHMEYFGLCGRPSLSLRY